jgi:hypothetical protein
MIPILFAMCFICTQELHEFINDQIYVSHLQYERSYQTEEDFITFQAKLIQLNDIYNKFCKIGD